MAASLKAAFAQAGITPVEAELNVALARYRNRGGTYERLMALARAAFELPEGHLQSADKGLSSFAFRQPDDAVEGQVTRAPQGYPVIAPTASPESDEEANLEGPESHRCPAPSSPPVRAITLVQGGYRKADGTFAPKPQTPQAVAAAVRAAQTAAVTVLETFKVRDGRGIGDVYLNEIDGLRAASIMEASVLHQIQKHAVFDTSANPRVREVVKASDIQRFIQRAAEVADAS